MKQLVNFMPVALLLLTALPVISQTESKDVFPVANDIKLAKACVQPVYVECLEISECVSGDCENGQGIYMIMHLLKKENKNDRKYSSFNLDKFIQYTFQFSYYEGEFNNNGTDFNGKRLIRNFYMEREIDDKRNLKARERFDYNNTTELKIEYSYKGLTKQKQNIRKNHPLDFLPEFIDLNTTSPRISQHDIFKDGKLFASKITYKPSDKENIIKTNGLYARQGNMVLGKIEYKDGSSYEGFLNNSVYEGSGIYKDKTGIETSGMWIDGKTAYELPLIFKPEMYEGSYDEMDLQKTAIELNGTVYSGKKMNLKDDVIFFISDSGKQFYHGNFIEEKPNGFGSYLNFEKSIVVNFNNDDVTEDKQIGFFENGILKEGVSAYRLLTYYYNREIPMSKVYTEIIKNGSFIDGKLQGCGTMLYTKSNEKADHVFYEGEFKDDKLQNWYYKRHYTIPKSMYNLNHVMLNKESEENYDKVLNAPLSKCLPELTQDLVVEIFTRKKDNYIAAENKRKEEQLIAAAKAEEKKIKAAKLKEERLIYCAKAEPAYGRKVLNTKGSVFYVVEVDCQKGIIVTAESTGAKRGNKQALYVNHPLAWIKDKTVTTETHNVMVCSDCNGYGTVIGYNTSTFRDNVTYNSFIGSDGNYYKFKGSGVKITTVTDSHTATCSLCNGTGISHVRDYKKSIYQQ